MYRATTLLLGAIRKSRPAGLRAWTERSKQLCGLLICQHTLQTLVCMHILWKPVYACALSAYLPCGLTECS
jgi:hypothetical protein